MKKVLILLIALMFLGSMLILQAGTMEDTAAKCKTPCKTKVVKCPVSGHVIAKDAKKVSAEYKGKTYYFCCEKCKIEFEKNPEKYVKACTCKTAYTCPMEKCNYKSDKPGKCPTCGMELKKAECTCQTRTKTSCGDKKKDEKETK
jgi:YHS domain-containing protein